MLFEIEAAPRVFDTFIFYNELDLLELRLKEHWDAVDFFVLCEATRTFRGEPKRLWFADNRDRFAEYLPKIIHVVVDDMPDGVSAWERERFQRQATCRGMAAARDSDVMLVSDCDELFTAAAIAAAREAGHLVLFDMPMFQFYMNMQAIPEGWCKAFGFPWGMRAEIGDFHDARLQAARFAERFPGRATILKNAGWHFTFLGGAERVREKLSAYSHGEWWQTAMLEPGRAERQMMELRDVGDGRQLRFRSVDASFPRTVQTEAAHYLRLGFLKEPLERLAELEQLLAERQWDVMRLEGEARWREAELRLADGMSSLARKRPATQSSVPADQRSDKAHLASAGCNGMILRRPWFRTGWQNDPWWQVDLGRACAVRRIAIFSDPDGARRPMRLAIYGSVDGAAWEPLAEMAEPLRWDCDAPLVLDMAAAAPVRFVRVQLLGFGALQWDEAMLFGEAAGGAE
ncbi:MAG TPA: discoidin domain-containing protein [Acetobacteraceae bacterium]|nr:discoidin domain-containing protein [Acetobacteraceae bacterium]